MAKLFFTAGLMVVIGAGIYLAPTGTTDRVRGVVNDSLRPGLKIFAAARARFSAKREKTDGDSLHLLAGDFAEELELLREQNRILQIRLAEFEERDRVDQNLSTAVSKPPRLVLPTLIEAAVLGDTVADDWCGGKLIDLGSKGGIRENELVLASRKSKRTLIDIGHDSDLSTEDALLLGRCVVGKVEHVGRWTSTIQLVTDVGFRGRAQLIRETTDGFVFDGARGILKGMGEPLCKLEGIPAESSVHVNDAVFTADRDGIQPVPLFYGHVVEATLEADDREWIVYVKPVALPASLTTINVLRLVTNPDRLAVK